MGVDELGLDLWGRTKGNGRHTRVTKIHCNKESNELFIKDDNYIIKDDKSWELLFPAMLILYVRNIFCQFSLTLHNPNPAPLRFLALVDLIFSWL